MHTTSLYLIVGFTVGVLILLKILSSTKMKIEYNYDVRENKSTYLLRQVQELLIIAAQRKSTSPLIYACLDARIALEVLDLNIILHSVSDEEREQILEDSKPKNGIDRTGKKQGALKERYQLFYQAVCEVFSIEGKAYDFKKSKEIQYKLSTYVHSYYMTEEELKYDSHLMQNALVILKEFEIFVKTCLPVVDNSLIVMGVEIKTIPEKDKIVLEEWKQNSSMEYEELKSRIKQNHPDL